MILLVTVLLSLGLSGLLLFLSFSRRGKERLLHLLAIPVLFFLLNWGVYYTFNEASIRGPVLLAGAAAVLLFIFFSPTRFKRVKIQGGENEKDG
jgi:hypothetical protein